MGIIKRYINHLSLNNTTATITDPISFLNPNDSMSESLNIDIVPGEYGCFVYQDYENNPKELRIINDNIFTYVKDESEIACSEYLGSIHVNNYIGIFDKEYNLLETNYIKLCNFLNEHQDNTYHVSKPWFNTFIFKEKRHDSIESVIIRAPQRDCSVYVMRNKYRKIIAIRILFI